MSNFKELVRVGKDDAVVRFTQAGKAVTGWSAAFDSGWGDNKQTVWLDCSWWGERGQKVAEYITKGSQLVIEGNIGTRMHNDKTYITLDVSEVKLIGGKQDSPHREKAPSAPRREAPPVSKASFDDSFSDDDPPF